MPLTRLEKTLLGLSVGAVLGGLGGAILGKLPPFTLPENETIPGNNETNFLTAIEAGTSIGAFTGAAIGLAA